jgi:hypothetical protein
LLVACCFVFAPVAQAGWLPPVDVSESGEHLGEPQVVLDSAGNATAVWDRWNGEVTVVESAYRPAGGGWQAPVVLSVPEESGPGEPPPFTPNGGSARIAVDADGDATVVWETYGANDKMLIQSAARSAGGAWQAPVTLDEMGLATAPEPWVAVDAIGNATVVWRKSEVIRAAFKPDGEDWQAPVPISDPEEASYVPQAAMNSDGDATVVWMEADGSNYVVRSALRPAGGGWEAPTLVSAVGEYAGNPHIALDPEGDAMVVWRGENEGVEVARAAYRPAGTAWQAPVDVSVPGEPVQQLRIALYGGGEAMVVWAGSTGEVGGHNVVRAARRPAGGSWEAPVGLSDDDENAFPADVAFDADGNAAVVWGRSDGTHQIIQAAYRPAGSGWEAPVDLSATDADAMDAVVVLGAPGVSAAAEGVATALWTRVEAVACSGKLPCYSYTLQAAGYDAFPEPAEGLEVPEQGIAGTPVEISVPPQNIWSPLLDFGDGATAASTSAAHVYAEPGEYTVRFTSTEVLGYQSSAERTVSIVDPGSDEGEGGQDEEGEGEEQGGSPSSGDSLPSSGPQLPNVTPEPADGPRPGCLAARAERKRALHRLGLSRARLESASTPATAMRLQSRSRKDAALLRRANRRLTERCAPA